VAADLRGDLLGAKAHLRSLNDLWLWTGVVGPAVAWASDLTISYAIVKWSCGHQARTTLHMISAIALAAVIGSAIVAWNADRSTERERFMAMLALMMAAFFSALVVATAIPGFVLDVCQ
jgi:hypothetical protein